MNIDPKMKIGFIGAGNMASAIIDGVLSKKFCPSDNIFASRRNHEELRKFCSERGIKACKDNKDLAEQADIIVLGIKPQQFFGALAELKDIFKKKNTMLISIAAGLSLEQIENMAGQLPIVRAMPNVNSRVGQGMTGISFNAKVDEDQKIFARSFFECLGKTMELEEDKFSIFSALAGASPAFVFMFIEAMAKAGVKEGLSKKEATFAAAQALYGSAKLLMELDMHPMALVDMVCSPGGTTIAGVASLEDNGFTATVMQAVAATSARDKELKDKK